jgi:hypothetical protein
MAAVTFKRIDQLYGFLTEIVNDPIALNKRSVEEQNSRMAKGCLQVCELLKDWLAGDVWNGIHASADGPATDFAEDQVQMEPMLRTLPDFFKQASAHMRDVRPELVDQAREALKAAAVRDQELFKNAEARVGALRDDVCELARTLYGRNVAIEKKNEARAKARRLLTGATALLPALIIAMASVSPSQVPVNMERWTHDVRMAVGIIVDITARNEIPGQKRIRRAPARPPPTRVELHSRTDAPPRGAPGQRGGSGRNSGDYERRVQRPPVDRRPPEQGNPGSRGRPGR